MRAYMQLSTPPTESDFVLQSDHSGLMEKSMDFNKQKLQSRDMNLIRDWLYLGCQAAEQGPVQELNALGITHVVQMSLSLIISI